MLEGVWAPLKSPDEVIADSQALANGFVTPVRFEDGGHYLTGASPAQFDGRASRPRRAPKVGEHTDEVLAELGHSKATIERMRSEQTVA